MRKWNLGAGDPLCLTLAADACLSSPDYTNDHIWEISLEGGEPPALTLHTTFGLRAGWLRLFPRFIQATGVRVDPSGFARPPRLVQFAPNYLVFSFSPFQEIDVLAEYWVPGSQTVAGRMTFANTSVLKESLRLEWAAVLNPLGQGESMSPLQSGSGYLLTGKTEDLFPVFVMAGLSQPIHSPFPALGVDLELFPGSTRPIQWALASLPDREAAHGQARQVLSAPWDAELARVTLFQQHRQLEIETGDPDWDAAFAQAQKTALGLFFPPSQHLPHASFVTSRQPDQGHSHRGDGSDYGHGWSGQTALDAWYLSGLLLPGSVDLMEGLLRNFLSVQNEAGEVDWRPGLAGQRSRYLAQPLLCALAWRIDQHKSDHAWLADIYPGLLRFLQSWLEPQHDRDGDGFPEWDHPLQTGYEENPLYDRWNIQAQGVDITTIESPALPALLYRETTSLMRIARRAGIPDDLAWMEEQAGQFREMVEKTWDEPDCTYRFRDYQTHLHPPGSRITGLQGSGTLEPGQAFEQPLRLLLRVKSVDDNTRAVRIKITGETPSGMETEVVTPLQFLWVEGLGRATSQNAYRTIERVEVEGLQPGDRGWIHSVGYNEEALPLLLPLWAGIPTPERAQVLIDNTLLGRYLGPFGLPMCPIRPRVEGAVNLAYTYMVWNQMIGEGLLAYDRRTEAADLVTRIMHAVIPVLKQQRAFRQFYHAHTGQPYGERNLLSGLPPLSLFLQAAGIEAITEEEILLRGFNPFPWPITVKYRGIVITRQQQSTSVTYSDGQAMTLDGSGPYRLRLS